MNSNRILGLYQYQRRSELITAPGCILAPHRSHRERLIHDEREMEEEALAQTPQEAQKDESALQYVHD
ncbi:hypothetical protein RSAG8_04243, partial [Rhizoctonia solani AG-8 WAC10335]